jgi:hypothetical protein
MSDSEAEAEEASSSSAAAASGRAAPSASALEQGSALEVTVSLLGATVTVAQDPRAGGHHATVWDGARAARAH